MDSPIIITLDSSKLNARTEELHDALIGMGQEGDAQMIFEQEAKLFTKQVIRLTPPNNREQGQNAIRRDLLKIFTPVHEDFVDDVAIEHGTNNIDTWLTTVSGERKHIKWDRIDNTGQGMKTFHRSKQNRRGRTYNLKKTNGGEWYAPYVVTFQDFATYRDKLFSRVGRRKSAWAKSFIGLGGRAAGWISRHLSGAKGELIWNKNPEKPSITMRNFSPGINDDERIVRSALRVRHEAIGKRIRLVLSGYSKDVKNGIKISRKTHRAPMEEAA